MRVDPLSRSDDILNLRSLCLMFARLPKSVCERVILLSKYVHFVTDAEGHKRAVTMPLDECEELMEDLHMGYVAGENPLEKGLIGGREKRAICIVDYDPDWPNVFEEHANRIAGALGDTAVQIEHIGSTSVPGLAAKPVIDILVVVPDSSDESQYLTQLENAGYLLRVREPEWNQHRMFRTAELDVHIHVYSSGCDEVARLVRFRNRLRENVEDRNRYEEVKRALAEQDWPDMNDYAAAKTEVIESILGGSENAGGVD